MSRKNYTEEFKQNALKLVEAVGFKKASMELGVTSKSLRNWANKKIKSSKTSPKEDKFLELELELKKAKKEIRNLKLINDVLKKSTAIFSKDHIGD